MLPFLAPRRRRFAERDDKGEEEKAGEPIAPLIASCCSRLISNYSYVVLPWRNDRGITINDCRDVRALFFRGHSLHTRDGVAVIESLGIIQSLRRPTLICHTFGTPAIFLLIPQNSLQGGALRARRRPGRLDCRHGDVTRWSSRGAPDTCGDSFDGVVHVSQSFLFSFFLFPIPLLFGPFVHCFLCISVKERAVMTTCIRAHAYSSIMNCLPPHGHAWHVNQNVIHIQCIPSDAVLPALGH